jgi:hypothetical protein
MDHLSPISLEYLPPLRTVLDDRSGIWVLRAGEKHSSLEYPVEQNSIPQRFVGRSTALAADDCRREIWISISAP